MQHLLIRSIYLQNLFLDYETNNPSHTHAFECFFSMYKKYQINFHPMKLIIQNQSFFFIDGLAAQNDSGRNRNSIGSLCLLSITSMDVVQFGQLINNWKGYTPVKKICSAVDKYI